MTTLTVAGTLLTAATDSSVLPYRLLPFNEPGRTNLGTVTASAGAIEVPADVAGMFVNLEHEYTRPAGAFVSVTEEDDGLYASVRYFDTSTGRDVLLEAKEGARTGISVEIEDPVIRNGQLMSGRLSGAGAVVRPAFTSARLAAAEDTGPEPEATEDDGEPVDAETAEHAAGAADALGQAAAEAQAVLDEVAEAGPTTPDADAAEDSPPTNTEGSQDMTASTPRTPAAFAAASGTGPTLTATETFTRTATEKGLTAALAQITQADVFDKTAVPEYVGELWKGRKYTQRFAPLVSHAAVTGMKIKGWKWVTPPQVGDYAGNLAEVPTNAVELVPVEFDAARMASGHKVDRIHFDLNDGGFLDSFLSERSDDYARKMDAKVLAHLATAGNHTAVTMPAGTDPWAMLVRAARRVLDFATPDYAIIGADLYEAMALLTDQDRLAFLNSSLGLEEGRLDSLRLVGAPDSATSMTGRVIVGAQAATTLYELPGGPIRVDAQDVAHGGVDLGLFGYYGLNTSDARGVVSVTLDAPVAG